MAGWSIALSPLYEYAALFDATDLDLILREVSLNIHRRYLVVILFWKGWNEKEENKTPISAKLGSVINGYETGDSTKGRICIECFVFLYTAIIGRLLIDNDACASLQTLMMDDVSFCLSLSLYFFSDIIQILKSLSKVFLFPKSFRALFNFSVSPSYINM